MSSEREAERLCDIIENIEAALAYVADATVEQFAADRRSVDATERCLERIIGATIKIGEERMERIARALPFHMLHGMGNIPRHAYDDVDQRIIYMTITKRLPEPLDAARRALA